MVDCQQAPLSFETPVWNHECRLDSIPSTPRVSDRVSSEMSKRVLANIGSLSAPSFEEGSPKKRIKPLTFRTTASNSALFHAAMKRMKEGGPALQRLMEQRDAEDTDRLTRRMQSLQASSGEQPDKASLSSVVTLGRNIGRGHSGVARSA